MGDSGYQRPTPTTKSANQRHTCDVRASCPRPPKTCATRQVIATQAEMAYQCAHVGNGRWFWYQATVPTGRNGVAAGSHAPVRTRVDGEAATVTAAAASARPSLHAVSTLPSLLTTRPQLPTRPRVTAATGGSAGTGGGELDTAGAVPVAADACDAVLRSCGAPPSTTIDVNIVLLPLLRRRLRRDLRCGFDGGEPAGALLTWRATSPSGHLSSPPPVILGGDREPTAQTRSQSMPRAGLTGDAIARARARPDSAVGTTRNINPQMNSVPAQQVRGIHQWCGV